jgi:hypothetical protein
LTDARQASARSLAKCTSLRYVVSRWTPYPRLERKNGTGK